MREQDHHDSDPKPTPPRAAPAAEPDPVTEADEESFPASDAPAWTPLHTGAPRADERR